eukprot:gene21536-28527_t
MAVATLELGTRYSLVSSTFAVEHGAVTSLLRFMRMCNRSKPHDCMAILGDRLQYFRDLEILTKPAQLAAEVARSPPVLKQWEGVAVIIGRKMEMERRYIAKLEGQKGSDVSAKEATRKMISAAKQLDALQSLIGHVLEVAEAQGIPIVLDSSHGMGHMEMGGHLLEAPHELVQPSTGCTDAPLGSGSGAPSTLVHDLGLGLVHPRPWCTTWVWVWCTLDLGAPLGPGSGAPSTLVHHLGLGLGAPSKKTLVTTWVWVWVQTLDLGAHWGLGSGAAPRPWVQPTWGLLGLVHPRPWLHHLGLGLVHPRPGGTYWVLVWCTLDWGATTLGRGLGCTLDLGAPLGP